MGVAPRRQRGGARSGRHVVDAQFVGQGPSASSRPTETPTSSDVAVGQATWANCHVEDHCCDVASKRAVRRISRASSPGRLRRLSRRSSRPRRSRRRRRRWPRSARRWRRTSCPRAGKQCRLRVRSATGTADWPPPPPPEPAVPPTCPPEPAVPPCPAGAAGGGRGRRGAAALARGGGAACAAVRGRCVAAAGGGRGDQGQNEREREQAGGHGRGFVPSSVRCGTSREVTLAPPWDSAIATDAPRQAKSPGPYKLRRLDDGRILRELRGEPRRAALPIRAVFALDALDDLGQESLPDAVNEETALLDVAPLVVPRLRPASRRAREDLGTRGARDAARVESPQLGNRSLSIVTTCLICRAEQALFALVLVQVDVG